MTVKYYDMKKFTLENSRYKVTVKETGAELCGFESLKSGREYIWQADTGIWASHAPNLFPIIGCLKGDAFIFKGKEYKWPKHGFIRNNSEVKLVEQTDNSLTFGMRYSEDTLKVYPFRFEFRIKYTLDENTLKVEHIIINHGDEEMLFSVGGHPGFTCPLNKGEKYNDYYLEFEKPDTSETWQVQKDGLIAKDTLPVFDKPGIINLHPNIFNNDALVFKDLKSRKVSLKSRKSNQVLTVSFEDFPYLGIWAKPNAPYVCIEPWIGIADSYNSDRDFEHKEGLVTLASKSEFTASYFISVEE
jgi:galactose mutarotase-like enzyme